MNACFCSNHGNNKCGLRPAFFTNSLSRLVFLNVLWGGRFGLPFIGSQGLCWWKPHIQCRVIECDLCDDYILVWDLYPPPKWHVDDIYQNKNICDVTSFLAKSIFINYELFPFVSNFNYKMFMKDKLDGNVTVSSMNYQNV